MRITLKDPDFESLTIYRTNTYPHNIKLRLKVLYRKAVLTVEREGEQEEYEYDDGFYILTSRGLLRLWGREGRSAEVDVRILNGWCSWKSTIIEITSKPLLLDEIYEIDQILGSSDVKVSWSVNAYGLLDYELYRKYGINPGLLVQISIPSDKFFVITRQDFVKNILQPADMLRRLFVEVVIEPVDNELLSKITDVDVREALRILVDKQRLLQEALNKLYTASEYRDVISDVRRAIEGIVLGTSAGDRIASALKEAFRDLGIAHEIEDGALDEVVNELEGVLLGKKSFTNAIYGYTSVLGVHTTEIRKPRRLYKPRPYRHDAEFAVLQAMTFLNYLIRVLMCYALRTDRYFRYATSHH